jgi:phosphoglycolate phosphatase-like HAD superfamily hydrolase
VEAVDAICFDPVGTLADFPARPLREAVARVFGKTLAAEDGQGSHVYWELLELLASCEGGLTDEPRSVIQAAETEAASVAFLYDDAGPALEELSGLGVRLIVASSLGEQGVERFLARLPFRAIFNDVWSRDAAGGVGEIVLRHAVSSAALAPGRVLFLTDTGKGLQTATRAGVLPILMMNDPDEAMRLTACEPAGGIVSLHELPDMVRLVAARRKR